MATQAQLAAVQQLYVGYLGRAADSAGQQFWANAIANGTATIASVATGFTLSAEYKAAYGGLTTDALVEKVYNNVLGRTPDAEGKAFWVAALASGKVTADTLVATIVTNLGALDQQTINNKVFVAQTYTDTVGAAYNPAAGAEVLVGVTNDTATVNAALDKIATGTLPGGVPGLSLINAITAAEAAVVAYEKEAATSNAALDADKDGAVTSIEANKALVDAKADRADPANGGANTIATLQANVTNATDDLSAAKAAASALTGGAAAISAYDNAVAVDAAATAAVDANAAATAAAVAGLQTTVTNGTSAVTLGTLATAAGVASFANAQAVLDFLSDSTKLAADRTKLVTELNKVTNYGAEVVKAGDLGLTADKADIALGKATTDLQAIDSNAVAPGSEGQDYIDAQAHLKTATDILANAKTADEKVAAVQAVVDKFTALSKTLSDAKLALDKFDSDNSTKIDIQKIADGAVALIGDNTKSDVFYFGSKVDTANDGTIAKFGTGDSLVLSKDLTFNSGALTTGDNNKSEFFLIQKGADVQVVIETAAYGSSDAVTTGPSGADHAAVITLTGVNVADLTVSNGIISHVA